MVNYGLQKKLDSVFSSLADPTRRDILGRISRQTLTVSEIAKPYRRRLSLPAISKHIRVLERGRLIKRKKEGRQYRFRLTPKPLLEALVYISSIKSKNPE